MRQTIRHTNSSQLKSIRNEEKEVILFSEILEHIPSADQLIKLFPSPLDPGKTHINPFGLEVLKLRLEGLTLKQISEQLDAPYHRVRYWSQTVKNCLINGHIADHVIVDIPALQVLLHMEVSVPTRYSKLSELLRDMPSDEYLAQLDQRYGKLCRSGRHQPPLTRQDLYILQQRASGRTYKDIGEELEISQDVLRRRVRTARRILQWNFKIELDIPELFPSARNTNRHM